MNSGIACLFVLETAETRPMPMNNDKIWRLRRQTEQKSLALLGSLGLQYHEGIQALIGPFGQSWSTIP